MASRNGQRARVQADRATLVAANVARQAAANRIEAITKLNEKDSLSALKTAVSALTTALLSDPR